jgi:hypothetical protein
MCRVGMMCGKLTNYIFHHLLTVSQSVTLLHHR